MHLEALARSEATSGPTSLRTALSARSAAMSALALGDLSDAERLARLALDKRTAAVGADSPQLVEYLGTLARVLESSGAEREAVLAWTAALQAFRNGDFAASVGASIEQALRGRALGVDD